MRSRTAPGSTHRCPRCWIVQPHCLCAHLPCVETRTDVLLVRHVLERWKTTNTARLALLALGHARLVDYGLPEEPFDDAPLRAPGTWLVFPGGEPGLPELGPPRRIVIVDGTWPQARRMVQRIPALQTMPRLVPPATKPSGYNLRRAHFEGGLSTLEAIARALALLEGEAVAAPLLALQALAFERVLRARGQAV